MKRCKALTLVELLIASSIFLVMMLTIYSAFHTGVFGYRNIEATIDTNQAAKQILERINTDLRNCFVYSKNESKFIGNYGQISFLTIVDRYSEEQILEDYCLVSYEAKENKLMRLCRYGKDSLNEESETPPEEMASNVEEVYFSYGYLEPPGNSLVFKDLWDEALELPVAIRVKLTLKNKTKQDFERTIFLP